MNKIRNFILLFFATLGTLFFFTNDASANTIHTVQPGDTFWKLGVKYGVSVHSIKKLNNRTSDMLYVGERIKIPASVSESEKDLLARLVLAEAQGEPYAGKVAVATVVLNRVDHPGFPNTVHDVIYERTSTGHYAFTPVANGQINKPADAESIRAVNEALAFRGQGSGSLYFYNPKTATNQWIKSRPITVIIGNHVFAK